MTKGILENIIVVTEAGSIADVYFAYDHLQKGGYKPFFVRQDDKAGAHHYVCRRPTVEEKMDKEFYKNSVSKYFEGVIE